MKRVKIIFLVFLTWFILHEIVIVADGLSNTPTKSEYGVILGNKVNQDGSLSDRLKARLDKGLSLYNDSLVEKLFVSGGLGKEGHYEAQVMANYLIQQGVPKSDIIIDDYGNNTWSTATNFKTVISNQTTAVIVVTQYYHVTRSKLAFKKLGFTNVQGASPMYFEWRDGYALFREFFGFYKYLIVY